MQFPITVKDVTRYQKDDMGRFGGGWIYNCGIAIGKRDVILECIWWQFRITWKGF